MTTELSNTCACGCGTKIVSTNKWSIGHNVRMRRDAKALVVNGRLHEETYCNICGKTYTKRADSIKKKKGGSDMCSKECLAEFRHNIKIGTKLDESEKTGIYKNCETCNEKFYVIPYRVEHSNPRFCSYECKYQKRRESSLVTRGFMTARKKPMEERAGYKSGEYVGTGVRKRRKLKDAMIKRDGGNHCAMCGSSEKGIHIHRIVPNSRGGKYELENCIYLCPEDHERVHFIKWDWESYLYELIKKKR